MKIDNMIMQLCPNGIQRVKLEEACIILDSQRKPVTKGNRIPGPYPYYGANGIQDYVAEYIFDGQFLLVGEDGSVLNSDNTPVINWAEGKIWVNNHAHILQEKTDVARLRYLFHILQTLNIKELVHGIPPKLNQANLRGIEIPLPPLPVQEEIVRILDSMTELQQNLQDELEARKKQYEAYREKLLTFSELGGGIKRLRLSEIGYMEKGKGIQKSDFMESGVPCIHYGQIHTYYGTSATTTKSFVCKELAKAMAHKGDIVIATTSEDVSACCKAMAWLGDEDVAVSGDAHIFHHNQDPMYIAYLFQTEQFASQKKKAATGTKVVRVSGDAMLKFSFDFPPIEKQREISGSLGAMEAVMSNIKQEIAARNTQYQYYREQLLSI